MPAAVADAERYGLQGLIIIIISMPAACHA
jgi:hypothetical protein